MLRSYQNRWLVGWLVDGAKSQTSWHDMSGAEEVTGGDKRGVDFISHTKNGILSPLPSGSRYVPLSLSLPLSAHIIPPGWDSSIDRPTNQPTLGDISALHEHERFALRNQCGSKMGPHRLQGNAALRSKSSRTTNVSTKGNKTKL